MATYPLRRVTRLPDVCVSRWRLRDGTEHDYPLSATVYRAMQMPGTPLAVPSGADLIANRQPDGATIYAVRPQNPTGDSRAVFLLAWSEPRFDTPSGQLGPGDVGVYTTGADWFNGGSALVIGLEARDRRPLVLRPDEAVMVADNVATMTVAATKRDGVQVLSGQLLLDDTRRLQ